MTTIIGYYRGFSVTNNGDGTAHVHSPDGQIVGGFDASDDSLTAIEKLVDTRDDAEPKEGSGWCCASCHGDKPSLIQNAKEWAVAFAIGGVLGCAAYLMWGVL